MTVGGIDLTKRNDRNNSSWKSTTPKVSATSSNLSSSSSGQCVTLCPSLGDNKLAQLVSSGWGEASVIRPVSAAVAGRAK